MNPLDTFYFNWAKIGILCSGGMPSTDALTYITPTGDESLDLVFSHIETSFTLHNFDNTFTYLDELRETYPEIVLIIFYIHTSLEMYTGSFMVMEQATVVYGILKKITQTGEVTPEMKGYIQDCFSIVVPAHPIRVYLQSVHSDLAPITDESYRLEVTEKQVFPLHDSFDISSDLQTVLQEMGSAIGDDQMVEKTALQLGWYEKILSK